MDVNNADCLEYMDWYCYYGARRDAAQFYTGELPVIPEVPINDLVDYDENY